MWRLAASSPRSMRFASSTSCAAVSSGTRPISLRKSWSESVESSDSRLGRELHLGRLHDGDLELVEGVVEAVHLGRVQVELVEGACDVLGAQRSCGATGLDEDARLVEQEDVAPGAGVRFGRGRALFRVRADAELCQKASGARIGHLTQLAGRSVLLISVS